MSTSVVMRIEGLSNRVSIIIRMCIDHIWLFRLSHFFRILLFLFVLLYMGVRFVRFCLILQIMYNFCFIFFC